MEKIDNPSDDSIWYCNNVFYIFASGCIFTSEDKLMLESILKYFSPSSDNKYLRNKIVLMSYEDKDMQIIEKKLLIASGNYHICMITGVYNNADLSKAPDKSLAHKGIISYSTSWQEISDFIVNDVSKYGLKDVKPETETETKTGRSVVDDFDLNDDIEKNIAVINELEKQRQIKKPVKVEKQGLYARIRKDKNKVPTQYVEFEGFERKEKPKTIQNTVQFYDSETDGNTLNQLDARIGNI